jgi:hypothetical protein
MDDNLAIGFLIHKVVSCNIFLRLFGPFLPFGFDSSKDSKLRMHSITAEAKRHSPNEIKFSGAKLHDP